MDKNNTLNWILWERCNLLCWSLTEMQKTFFFVLAHILYGMTFHVVDLMSLPCIQLFWLKGWFLWLYMENSSSRNWLVKCVTADQTQYCNTCNVNFLALLFQSLRFWRCFKLPSSVWKLVACLCKAQAAAESWSRTQHKCLNAILSWNDGKFLYH